MAATCCGRVGIAEVPYGEHCQERLSNNSRTNFDRKNRKDGIEATKEPLNPVAEKPRGTSNMRPVKEREVLKEMQNGGREPINEEDHAKLGDDALILGKLLWTRAQ